jgi:hypothetical protein
MRVESHHVCLACTPALRLPPETLRASVGWAARATKDLETMSLYRGPPRGNYREPQNNLLRFSERYRTTDGGRHQKCWKLNLIDNTTHVNTCRLVAMLFQQLVNRMCSHCLFPACWQVVNGLLATCYKVVELSRLGTCCSNNLLSSSNSTICQQVVSDNLVATW